MVIPDTTDVVHDLGHTFRETHREKWGHTSLTEN